jgi:putative drug exporter of the RND superfamily
VRAVRIGLRETGAAATGAGLVTVAALIPFLTTSFVNVQQFGIGVAVAVLLDVLVVRAALLPAAEIVLGALRLVADVRPVAGRPGAGLRPPAPRIAPAPPQPPTRHRP